MTSDPTASRQWRVAVAYWRDGGNYPRAASSAHDDPYLRAVAVMVASLRRVEPGAVVEWHTNLTTSDGETAPLVDAGVTLVATPFEHRMPEGYFHKFSASTYSIDVLHALAADADSDTVALLVDSDIVWLRTPASLIDRAATSGLAAYPIPYPPDFEELGFTRRRLSALAVEMSGRPAPADGLIAHLGGELLAATPDELRRFADACGSLWRQSVERFHADRAPWLHTEEHVYSAAFHQLGYGDSHTTDAIRRVWTRPGRLRNVRHDDADRVAWHALTEKGRGLDRLYADVLANDGAFEPGITDAMFARRAARHLSIHPSPFARLAFGGSRINARLRRLRRGPMPA